MAFPVPVPPSHSGDSSELWGVVVAAQANFYGVTLFPSSPLLGLAPMVEPPRETLETVASMEYPKQLLCTRRARLKKIGQQVMVGDRVRIEDPDWDGGRGAIAEVYPRQTQLDRPPIANADQMLLVFALAEPALDLQQLSRFLVKAESTGLRVLLCLNKEDLVSPTTRHQWQIQVKQWGYDPLILSLKSETGLQPLIKHLKARITVVSGPSGVGKSSLINQLIPQATLRTGAVSGKLGRGRHTTRHVELFELPDGGFLADTPGFNQPDLALTPAEIGACFPEIRDRLALAPCQFKDCLHRDEPGCTVGTNWDRYDFYLAMVDDALATKPGPHPRREEDSQIKVKTGELGQIYHEPLLQAKRYRRQSRRHQKQSLEDLRYELPNSLVDLESLEDLDGEIDLAP